VITGTLTLFHWSLRSDVRTIWPHVVRAGFALFMLESISAAFVDSFTAAGPGLRFFESLCLLNVLLISVSGISYFVSAVTEEKDAGTLALLRLAGVTPLAIILGKSTSRLISSLMLLFIQLPFTFLAITLGGVTWQQILASYLALAAWMAFVANIALFCSVRCQTSGRAAGLSAAVLFLFFTVSKVITLGLAASPPGYLSLPVRNGLEWIASCQQSLSILPRLQEILYDSRAADLIDSQFTHDLMVSGVLFLLSVLMFDRWSSPQASPEFAISRNTRRYTIGRCWKLPLVWKDFLFFTGGRAFFLTKFVLYGGILLGFGRYQQWTQREPLFPLTGDASWNALLTLLSILNIEVLLYAAGTLFAEVRQTTISSLAMLPISTPRLLLEKSMACLLATLPAIFWTAVLLASDWQNISMRCSATMVVTFFVVLLLSSHLTVLLSLMTRWGALPLALLITAACFMCCPMVILSMFSVTDAMARSHNLHIGLLLGTIVNLVWIWLFVLLPLELEIIRRWNLMSQQC
jgi:ABC-type transport system involved in multi-copper enzyme maturation permease subunit